MLKAFKNRRQSNATRTDELLSAYLDGMLTSDEQALLESRLRQEPALRERLEGLRLTVNLLADLPQVQTARNFILSPSMVAPPRPAAPKSRRRSWPIFGWATAAATLLFLLVFAGDVFFVAPTVRTQPTDIVAQAPAFRAETSVERGAVPPSDVADAVPPTGQTLAEPVTEEKETPVEEPPREITEAEPPPAPAMTEGMAEAEATAQTETEQAAPPSAEESVETAEAEQAPAEQAATPLAGGRELATMDAAEKAFEAAITPTEQPLTTFAQGTPANGDLLTATLETVVELETVVDVIVTPELATIEATEETALTVSPSAEPEEAEADVGLQRVEEQGETATAELEVTPQTAETMSAAAGVPAWLRLLEIGLGLTAVGLATATLLLRWRGV